MNDHLPDPETAPELFEGLLTRRVIAYVIDLTLIVCLTAVLAMASLVLGLVTLGLAWLGLPLVFPLAAILYYGFTLGAPGRSTVGMATMDLVLMPTRGAHLGGWRALAHPLVFWITVWIAWPVSLAVALFTPRRQLLHDLVVGTLMVRRTPFRRDWRLTADAA